MDGLSLDVGAEAAGGRENGNSKAGSHVHSKHRRSKRCTFFFVFKSLSCALLLITQYGQLGGAETSPTVH